MRLKLENRLYPIIRGREQVTSIDSLADIELEEKVFKKHSYIINMWKTTFLIPFTYFLFYQNIAMSSRDCTLYCNNVYDFSKLNETGWIIVPRTDDSCYFYNTISDISIEP